MWCRHRRVTRPWKDQRGDYAVCLGCGRRLATRWRNDAARDPRPPGPPPRRAQEVNVDAEALRLHQEVGDGLGDLVEVQGGVPRGRHPPNKAASAAPRRQKDSSMTPEQKAAYIVAQTALLNAEIAQACAANIDRMDGGKAPAYGEHGFQQIIDRYSMLQADNVIAFFCR